MALKQRGFFRTEDLVTDRFGLQDFVAQGLDRRLVDKSQIKIMVRPWQPERPIGTTPDRTRAQSICWFKAGFGVTILRRYP